MHSLQTLQDIVTNIKIESSQLSISHSYLPHRENPTAIVAQLQTMSSDIQLQYLNTQLSELIYSIYFEGSRKTEVTHNIKTNHQILKNIAALEIDWEFYEQLEINNQGQGFFHPHFRMVKQELDGSIAAYFDQFIIHIQRERHLPSAQQFVTVNDRITPRLPSSFIREDRYRANGDFIGNLSSENSDKNGVFVYLNFRPEVSVDSMRLITEQLNKNQIPFFFEVLHNPLNYGRYESGTLSFNSYHYKEFILPVLQAIYAENKSKFQAQIPLFTKELAPGIGLAEHPHLELKQRFGKNRCQIVANALLESHQNGDESPEARMKYIIQHFERLGIDLEHPYLNHNSEDIYTPLD